MALSRLIKPVSVPSNTRSQGLLSICAAQSLFVRFQGVPCPLCAVQDAFSAVWHQIARQVVR